MRPSAQDQRAPRLVGSAVPEPHLHRPSRKTDTQRQALNYLIIDGYVTDKTPHKLIKPYEV
jgi:hypothetical protein